MDNVTEKIYDVTFARFGYAKIKAKSEEEAFQIASGMGAQEIEWSDDFAATATEEV